MSARWRKRRRNQFAQVRAQIEVELLALCSGFVLGQPTNPLRTVAAVDAKAQRRGMRVTAESASAYEAGDEGHLVLEDTAPSWHYPRCL